MGSKASKRFQATKQIGMVDRFPGLTSLVPERVGKKKTLALVEGRPGGWHQIEIQILLPRQCQDGVPHRVIESGI